MKETILILGGIKEATTLARNLVRDKPEARIIYSMAGRTKEPKPVAGELRSGGFGGPVGLAKYMAENKVTQLIDCTHPFATQISRNARSASKETGTPLQVIERARWSSQPDDNWHPVPSIETAVCAIPSGAVALLALGSQHISPFEARDDVNFVVRMVDAPTEPLRLPNHELVVGRPKDKVGEISLLRKKHITHIVCRNSGGTGAYAKIEAARELALPVIMIERRLEN